MNQSIDRSIDLVGSKNLLCSRTRRWTRAAVRSTSVIMIASEDADQEQEEDYELEEDLD